MRNFSISTLAFILFALGGWTQAFGQCTGELLISAVLEGSSSNKCVEIYNPSASMVDLSLYSIELYSNGSATASSSDALAGMLAPGAYYLVCNPSTDGTLVSPDQTSGTVNFNGDDAFVVTQGIDIADVWGQIGVDPGSFWTGATSGINTQNNTWIRVNTTAADCAAGIAAFDPDVNYTSTDVINDVSALNSGVATSCSIVSSGLAVSSCDPADDTFTITIDPAATLGDAAGYTYVINSGSVMGPVAYGTPSVLGPFAADGTTTYDIIITDNGDDNCEMMVPTQTAPASCAGQGGPCTGAILITGVLEGSSSNKCIELYNTTAAEIDLSTYTIDFYNNGGTSANNVAMMGMIGAGEYFLVCDPALDGSLGIVPDFSVSGFLGFNGDDAFAINDGSANSDVFGEIGFDPGSAWTGSTSGFSTANATWCRTDLTSCNDGTSSFDPDALYASTGVQNDAACLNSGVSDVCTITGSGLQVSPCNSADDTFTITIDPTATMGDAAGYTYDLNGAGNVGPIAYGTPTVLGPFAADGSTSYDLVINDNTDVDCMMIVPTITAPAACSATGGCTGDLVIATYIEGSSSNKCIEIYNASAGMIDLSLYSIELYSNGGTSATSTDVLAGMLAPGAYYLVCNNNTSSALVVPDQYSGTINFNGDDAFVITGPNGVEDAWGQIGVDPGSAWTGSTSGCETSNQTWYNNLSGCSDGTAAFDPDAGYTCGAGSDDISGLNSGVAPVCSIDDAGLSVSACNANDDTFTISITPTASNGSAAGYSATVNGAAEAVVYAYGVETTFGPFGADGSTTYDIILTDDTNTSCSLTIPTITAPAACSTTEPCDSDAGVYPWDGN